MLARVVGLGLDELEVNLRLDRFSDLREHSLFARACVVGFGRAATLMRCFQSWVHVIPPCTVHRLAELFIRSPITLTERSIRCSDISSTHPNHDPLKCDDRVWRTVATRDSAERTKTVDGSFKSRYGLVNEFFVTVS